MRHSISKKAYFQAILAAWLGSVCGGAGAAEGALDTLLGMSLENLMAVEITTASKRRENIGGTPATVIVVTRRQIEQRRYINLIDLLEDLPGVEVFRNTKSTLYHNLSFRGNEGNSRILILQDGVRIDSPGGAKIPVADNFPLYHAKQVEILYGPAAALYGADAFGGVINIITENGAEIDGIRVSGALGSHDAQYHSIQAGTALEGGLRLAAGAHAQDSRMANLAEEYPASFPKVDAVTFGGQTVVPAAEREDYTGPTRSHSLFARLDWDKYLTIGYNSTAFRHLTSTGDRPDTAFFLDEAQWNTRLETLYGKLRGELSERLSVELAWEHSVHEIDPKSKFYNIYVDFQDVGYEYAISRKNSIEPQFEWHVNDRHTLIGGLSYADYYSLPQVPDLPQPYDRNTPLYAQNLYYPNTGETLPIVFMDASYTNTAAYLQWQANWNERLSTTVGLRYDDNSRYDSVLNPRLGLVYRFSPATVFKLLYGEAFRAPSTDEALATFGTFSGKRNSQGEYLGSNFRVPNPDLQPETSRNLEFSLSRALTPELDLSFNGFYAEIENLIATRNETVPSQFIPGASLSKTTVKDNLGQEHHYGLDIVLNWQHAFSPAWQGNLWGSYSYIDGKIQEAPSQPEVDLAYLTPHKLKLGATLAFQDKYFITPKLSLYGRGRTGRVNKAAPSERLEVPAYLVMDLHLGARDVYKGLSAYLDIDNLFDRHYTVPAGSASTTFVGMPQQTRSVMLTLHYQFR